MAGSYQDAPSRRMAWDADGTVGTWRNTNGTGASIELTPTETANLNGEQVGDHISGMTNNTSYFVALIFPELRELDGIFFQGLVTSHQNTASLIESSPDTTNGIDGSWATQITNIADFASTIPLYRDNITSMAVATERSLRITTTNNTNTTISPATIHVYGAISPAATPDRILFLDTLAADAVFTKPLDFGDVPRGQTQTRTFKIKNNSSTYTINTIQVTAEDLYLNAGNWYTFGIDDVTYQATYAAGNLGTGATLLLYMKQIIPDAETLGVQAGRIKVSHASLT